MGEDKKQNLLSAVSTVTKHEEVLSLQAPSPYNIFNILEVSAKEVIMCRFLADLLNPEGAHSCGILFLKSFLRDVLRKDYISDTLLAHTDVIKEYVIDHDRRIDIVIRNSRFFIPMEVKIYAGEQKGQCYDYWQFAKTYDAHPQMVYLTRFGTRPSEYSRRDKRGAGILGEEKIICLSWEQDIYRWLESFLPWLTEPVKTMVRQYMEAVHKIADGRGKRKMEENLKILFQSPDFFSAGLEIERSMKTARLRLMRLVFEALREEMDKIAPIYGLELEREAGYYTYDEKRHEKFYDYEGSTYPGINYLIKNAGFQKKSLRMWFRIEVEYNLFAGIALFDMEAEPGGQNEKGYQVDDITPELIEEAARYLDRDVIMPVDWWLVWCYSNGKRGEDDYADVPNFKEMNQCAVALTDERRRKEFAGEAVGNFEKHLLKHLWL